MDSFIDIIHEKIVPLPGHVPTRNFTEAEQIRRAKEEMCIRDRGGSMHTFFTPFGIYPNNAIVGGSGSIAVGAALYKKVNRKPGIVVANLGDASMARGPVWEGMTFAAMDQFKQLWSDEMKGGLPVIINIMAVSYTHLSRVTLTFKC